MERQGCGQQQSKHWAGTAESKTRQWHKNERNGLQRWIRINLAKVMHINTVPVFLSGVRGIDVTHKAVWVSWKQWNHMDTLPSLFPREYEAERAPSLLTKPPDTAEGSCKLHASLHTLHLAYILLFTVFKKLCFKLPTWIEKKTTKELFHFKHEPCYGNKIPGI